MPKLLPREYYKLDRAAMLLECEVEDLIHWGAIGAIDLCIQISSMNCDIADQREDIIPDSKYPSMDSFFFHNGLASYWVQKKYKHSSQERLSINIKNAMAKQSGDNIYNNADEFEYDNAKCGGFWPLPRSVFFSLEASNNGRYQLYGSHTLCCSEKSGLVFASVFFDDEEQYLTVSDLWITQKEFKKLYEALSSAAHVLPNIFNSDEIEDKSREQEQRSQYAKPHPRTESASLKREQVLAAAIYVKENDTELCGNTITDWADAISEKAGLFWPDTKEPPLSHAKIVTMISTAKNNGTPSIKD